MSHLIEPGTKYFLSESLRQSHHVKMQYYNSYFNLGCVVGIFIIICAVLWWKYKGRKTPFEIEEKEREKQIKKIIKYINRTEFVKKNRLN